MKSSGFDPRRLEVTAFTKARALREGSLPLSAMERLTASTQAPADGQAGEIAWSVQGLWKQPASGAPEMRLHLSARASVHLTCQRCLQPMAQALEVGRTIRFVPGEDEAARLDEELEEDVLALPRLLDLVALIEDEMILALPIVPLHESCPQPLAFDGEAGADIVADEDGRPNPFAALAALKSSR
jgi:uncharacterized protein